MVDIERLRRIQLFESFSEEELGQIAPFAEKVDVGEGKQLVREGDFSYEFLAIESGKVSVSREGSEVAQLGPGEFFGEMGLLEKELRSATVTTTEPSELISLTGWDLARVEKAMPAAIEKIRAKIEERRGG